MDDAYDETIISDGESDESAELRSLIDSYQRDKINHGNIKTTKQKHNHNYKLKKNKRNEKRDLDHLRERVTELMSMFEKRGLFIPPPPSLSEKGKVWSSRIYGADKKRSRKNAERTLLEDRIEQLEYVLKENHGIDL